MRFDPNSIQWMTFFEKWCQNVSMQNAYGMRRISKYVRRCMLHANFAKLSVTSAPASVRVSRRLASDGPAAEPAVSSKLLQFVPKHDPATVRDAGALANFLASHTRIFILTGAGISTESGIPDYRGEGVGLYSTSKRRPMEYQTFIGSEEARRRYWARNYIGWPRFSSFPYNAVHAFVAELEREHKIAHWVTTQNVDRLHLKAGSSGVTELHGTSGKAVCLGCGYRIDRHWLQRQLDAVNGTFCDATSTRPSQIRPDGDVELSDAQVASFVLPSCPQCSKNSSASHHSIEKPHLKGVVKPDIVFFGENVPVDRVEFVFERLAESDAVLVLGSSLFVYSGYRFIRAAKERHKIPVCIVNIGSTRGDPLADIKIDARCGEVIDMMKQLQYF